ncbi:GNAT family N-acetyltransferase [Desertibaculum subflavum]|uniref:GNAT family N-acetyltransferase n=1 Tax=Desertibaculum subflavum TaxID=2268458 RepID=UPI000E668A84
MTTLRDARPDECSLIQAIELAAASRYAAIGMTTVAAGDPIPLGILAARVASRGLIVAVMTDDEPIGFTVFRPLDGAAYIEEVDVLPAHAGRRLGAALLEEAGRRAAALGLAALTLSTFRHVPWNGPYYLRLGFVEMAEGELTPGLRAVRADNIARGLDETQRMFMRRPL